MSQFYNEENFIL